MSQKVVIGIIVVVVLLGGLWWFASQQGVPAVNPGNMPAAGNNTNNGAAISGRSTSDASLNQDLSNVDSQMNGFSADSANVDKGLNDQPIPQN